jgi:dihydroorotase
MTNSLLIRNVHPFEKNSKTKEMTNLLIGADGLIKKINPIIDTPDNCTEMDLKGAYLSRGWVDMHTHIYYGATDLSLHPEQIGMKTGVTCLVDCGSAGEANFEGFRRYIAESADENIFSFLNIGSIGLVACNRVSELVMGYRSINFERTIKVIEANRSLIRGIKLRASQVITGDLGIECVRLAKKIAKISRLPLIIHVGEPPPLLDDILPLLEKGDVITHAFNGKVGGNIMEDQRTFALAKEAQIKGVFMDLGHGSASFSFKVAKFALEQGISPDIISTDLHCHNFHGPVYDLPTTMSKLLTLGMSLENVIECVTTSPRIVLSEPAEENLFVPGQPAEFTAFTVESVKLKAFDSMGAELVMRQFIQPQLAVLGTKWQQSQSIGREKLAYQNQPLFAPESSPDMM